VLSASFDEDAWAEDLARTTDAGRTAAIAARRRYERSGVPLSELRPCERDARDGTDLPGCTKVYLPEPDGRFGLVFRFYLISGTLGLAHLAFGVRHHPPESHAPTVYQLAHDRLHRRRPSST
jgi:hypothetical protein